MALLEPERGPAPGTEPDSPVSIVGSALSPTDGPLGGLPENARDIPTSDQISIYVVREGDTLGSIARAFGVTVNTVRWNNDIKGSSITPGQTLVILPVSGIRHTVKKGDTIQAIAKQYKADLPEILSFNSLDAGDKLAIGDIVIVPDGEIVAGLDTPNGEMARRTRVVAPTRSLDGFFVRPVSGPRTQGIHGYNAVDIAPPAGTPVVAAAAGKVIVSREGGWNGGYGTYIVIQHEGGVQTLYAHNQSNTVSQGETVEQGQVIGYVGRTGRATGNHLHFEVRGAKNPF